MDQIEIDDAEHYAKSAGGLFDIRNVIGALFAIYGVILVIAGIIHRSAADLAKAGGNVNLWVGVGMLVVAAVFIGWALLRPIKVPSAHQSESK